MWPSDGERDSLAGAGRAAVSIAQKDGGLGGSEGGVTAAILLTSWLFKEQPEPKSGNQMGFLGAEGRGSRGSGSLTGLGHSGHTGFFHLHIIVVSNSNSTIKVGQGLSLRRKEVVTIGSGAGGLSKGLAGSIHCPRR